MIETVFFDEEEVPEALEEWLPFEAALLEQGSFYELENILWDEALQDLEIAPPKNQKIPSLLHEEQEAFVSVHLTNKPVSLFQQREGL